jgi:AcrR family transcriptional regulator
MRVATKVRRTQAERSAGTRALLLDAALDCLAELGYAGTTTTVVAERAGVSRGAELHHFPTRAALVAAAVQHLYARLTEEYRRGFERIAPEADRVRAALDLLWSLFVKPRYAAILELFVAARTDRELRQKLAPVSARHEANVFRLAHQYFPAAAGDSRFSAALSLILDAMQGMAIARFVHGRSADEPRRLQAMHDLAARVLASRTEEVA